MNMDADASPDRESEPILNYRSTGSNAIDFIYIEKDVDAIEGELSVKRIIDGTKLKEGARKGEKVDRIRTIRRDGMQERGRDRSLSR